MTIENYKRLVAMAHTAQTLYENAQETGMTDGQYDRLVQKIRKTEEEHPDWVEETSPTQIIFDSLLPKGFADVEHRNPMLSIRDVFTEADVASWVESVKAVLPDAAFVVEEKIDGTSLTVRYEDGVLVMGESRGNGAVGSDITDNVLKIKDIPHVLESVPAYLEVRGEAYMTEADFSAYCQTCRDRGEKIPANARNLAAGTLRSYDAGDVERRGIHFFAFNVQEASSVGLGISHYCDMSALGASGFKTVKRYLCESFEQVWEAVQEIGRNRTSLSYGIDGAVIKLDSVKDRERFPGGGSKYTPGHIAFKFEAESCVVELTDVKLGVGKTGKVSYVGIIRDAVTGEPAQLAGTSVSRVTLNNMNFIREMKLGIGGQYKLIKSGDIIPKLVGLVKEPEKVYETPTVCPYCGNPLTQTGKADLYCTNEDCVSAKIRTLISFGERDRMDIHGLGDTIAEALVRDGFVRDLSNLYELPLKRQEVLASGTMTAGVFDALVKAIDGSKAVPANRVLAALNIPNTGRSMSKALIAAFGSIDRVAKATYFELLSVEGVGPTAAESIVTFFDKNGDMVDRLREAGLQFEEASKESTGGVLAGETVVVTGKFVISGKTRTEVQTEVEKLGGKCGSSITSATTLLLVGENAGSKLAKAQAKGIRIMSEAEFLDMN